MKKVVFLVVALMFFIAGCEDQKKVSGSADSMTKSLVMLADGTGLQFAVAPTADNVEAVNDYKVRRIVFSFDDEYEDIEMAISEILTEAGFSRRVEWSKESALGVIYSKKGYYGVAFRFSSKIEALRVKSTLSISWRI